MTLLELFVTNDKPRLRGRRRQRDRFCCSRLRIERGADQVTHAGVVEVPGRGNDDVAADVSPVKEIAERDPRGVGHRLG